MSALSTLPVAAVEPSPVEIQKFLTVTTAHLPRKIAQQFDQDHSVPGALLVARTDDSYFVYIGDDRDAEELDPACEIDPPIAALVATARHHDCLYIRFDRDAHTIDGLETFDW